MMNDALLFDLSDFADADAIAAGLKKETRHKEKTRAQKTRQRHITRRAASEAVLADVLPPSFDSGDSWHVISGGDVDSMSFAAHVIGNHPIDYMLFSPWCMAMPDVERITGWIESGTIDRVDAYVGEIFCNQYPDEFAALCDAVRICDGRVATFKNHSKIMLFDTGSQHIVIESSANINTNPRTENTAIHVCADLFDFYKSFFDGIKAFNHKEFPAWQIW